MSAKQKQNFLHGALILMSATVIVKIIGYFFKVPLKGIIGVSGFGYFNAAYGLFNTLYALSVAGMPIAVSRMVAQNMQQGRYRDVRKIKRLSTVSFLCTGLLGTLLMFAGAGPYVRFAENPNAFLAVFVMAPAIFFVCVSSSYRGYYEGLRNMYPTAWSQISEALVKLACGLLFSSAGPRARTARQRAEGAPPALGKRTARNHLPSWYSAGGEAYRLSDTGPDPGCAGPAGGPGGYPFAEAAAASAPLR